MNKIARLSVSTSQCINISDRVPGTLTKTDKALINYNDTKLQIL